MTEATTSLARRLERVDWADAEAQLRDRGHTRIGALLVPTECRRLIRLYDAPAHFRSHVQMERHRFGAGDYRYFREPLPEPVAALRERLYAALVPAARRWMSDLRQRADFPDDLSGFRRRCAAAGQTRPTPLLLRYGPDGYNCLHRDLYGEVAFPFQLLVVLSRPGLDFEGGELLLVEQRPRSQSDRPVRRSPRPGARGCCSRTRRDRHADNAASIGSGSVTASVESGAAVASPWA